MRDIKFRVWNGKGFSLEPRIDMALLNARPGVCDVLTFGSTKVLQQFTGIVIDGREVYEGDLIRFEREIVSKSYKDPFDYKNPIFGTPTKFVYTGEVVFGETNDIDDFYEKRTAGWCIKTGADRLSSLLGEMDSYNPKGCYEDSYCKYLYQCYEVVGNIFENPLLVK